MLIFTAVTQNDGDSRNHGTQPVKATTIGTDDFDNLDHLYSVTFVRDSQSHKSQSEGHKFTT